MRVDAHRVTAADAQPTCGSVTLRLPPSTGRTLWKLTKQHRDLQPRTMRGVILSKKKKMLCII